MTDLKIVFNNVYFSSVKKQILCKQHKKEKLKTILSPLACITTNFLFKLLIKVIFATNANTKQVIVKIWQRWAAGLSRAAQVGSKQLLLLFMPTKRPRLASTSLL